VQDEIARPENVALAESVADRAVTLVIDGGKLIPLQTQATATAAQPASHIVAVIFSDRPRDSDGGRAFASELRKRAPGATVFFVDPSNSGYVFDNVLAAVRDAGSVIAIAESVPNPRRTTEGRAGGSVNLDAGPMQLLTEMVKTVGAKTIVVAFGNPYTGGSIPGIQTYVCTYSNTVVSASSLARALFGEIPIHGRLPVSIPSLALRGTGLDRDAIVVRASTP
jgi:beta-N-acetylhexosaminidase